MISLNETDYLVRCREMDLEVVKGVADKALDQYKAVMKEELGEAIHATVSVATDPKYFLAPPPSSGKAITWYDKFVLLTLYSLILKLKFFCVFCVSYSIS